MTYSTLAPDTAAEVVTRIVPNGWGVGWGWGGGGVLGVGLGGVILARSHFEHSRLGWRDADLVYSGFVLLDLEVHHQYTRTP